MNYIITCTCYNMYIRIDINSYELYHAYHADKDIHNNYNIKLMSITQLIHNVLLLSSSSLTSS